MSKMRLYDEHPDVVFVTQNQDPFFDYMTRKIFKEIDWSDKNARLLDLGCGTGRIVFEAAKRGMKAVGVDYVPKAIAIAKKQAKVMHLEERVQFFRGDLTRAKPRQYGIYDYIVLMEVVEHIEDYEKVINFAWGSLKKGGKLLLTTPNDPAFWTILDDYARHVRRFTLRQIKLALGKFSNVKAGIIGYPLHRWGEQLYNVIIKAQRSTHKPKLFRINPFMTKLYYIAGTGAMTFDDLFAYKQEKGTTIIAVATK